MKFKLNESTILEDSNPNPEENIGGPESDISPSLEKEIYDNSDIIVNDDDDQVFRALNRAYATAQQWADTQELLEPGEDNDVKLENILFIGEAGTGKTARTEQWAKANNINLVNIGTSSLGIEAVSGAVAPAERVGKDGVITAQESNSIKTQLSVVEGMQFERGYLSPYMSTDMEKMEAVLEEPLILVSDQKITSLSQILPLMEKVAAANQKLLIIADEIEGDALAALVLNKLRGTLLSVAVRAPSFGENRIEFLKDICVLTGASFISSQLGLELENTELEQLGRAKKVVVEKEQTTIIEGHGDREKILERAAQIRRELSDGSGTYGQEKLSERLAKLSGGVAVINVGAATEVEMNEKKLRIEDALAATKAAALEGIVPGGGVALSKLKKPLKKFVQTLSGDEKTGAQIVLSALDAPLKQIAENAGICGGVVSEKVSSKSDPNFGFDAYSNKYGNMFKLGIIDPTKVTRFALQNAASVASTLLTTECLVSDNPNEKDA